MINNLIDFSKALYHLDTLKASVQRSAHNINIEDKSILFLFNCMSEKIASLSELEKEYIELKKYIFKEDSIFIHNKRYNFIIYKNKQKDSISLCKDMAIFLTNKNSLFIPENEIEVLDKNYIFLGRYDVLIEPV